jgi:hypothetical protein
MLSIGTVKKKEEEKYYRSVIQLAQENQRH